MFIELAEILDCPVCADGFGLVAFVADAERRRVVRGRLGCPMCEIEYPIAEGAIELVSETDGEGQAATADGEPGESIGEAPSRDTALRLAALLGLGERTGSVLLLGPGLGDHAGSLATFADRVEIISVIERTRPADVDELSAGVNPVRGLTERWPVRSGALDGVALRGPVGQLMNEAKRCLASGRRLVLIDPEPDASATLEAAGFETLACDEYTWVGTRR